MKHTKTFLSVLCLLTSVVYAGTMADNAMPGLNQTGYYVGIGGSYNWLHFNGNSSATLNAISGLPPLGIFTGATGDYAHNGDGWAFDAKIGYLQPVNTSDWLWGLELTYQHAQTKATTLGANKDAGTYINLIDPTINVTDLITMGRVQMTATDLLLLPAFIGHTYGNGFIFLGAGPALFRVQRNVYDSSDTNSGYYLGNIANFTSTKLMWGGAVQAGLAYYLNPSWFLKFDYTYAITANQAFDNNVDYSRSNNGGLNNGTVFFNVNQRLSTQTAAISINRLFS